MRLKKKKIYDWKYFNNWFLNAIKKKNINTILKTR